MASDRSPRYDIHGTATPRWSADPQREIPMLPGTDRRIAALETELTRVRHEFEAAIDAVPVDQLHRAPAGHWTPAQIVWHVAKVERGVARLFERLDAAIPVTATVPPGPRPDQILTILDKYNFLDRSRKIDAPEGIRPPAPELVDLVAERARWTDGRAQLFAAMRHSGPRLSLMRFDHPIFGPFDGWQWALMIGRHEQRHMLQLHEVLAATA